MRDAEARRSQGKRSIEVDDTPLLDNGDGLQRVAFASLTKHHFEHLEKADRRDNECANLFNRSGEAVGRGCTREIGLARRGVDHINASPSHHGWRVCNASL